MEKRARRWHGAIVATIDAPVIARKVPSERTFRAVAGKSSSETQPLTGKMPRIWRPSKPEPIESIQRRAKYRGHPASHANCRE
jgi:hypothetical protein